MTAFQLLSLPSLNPTHSAFRSHDLQSKVSYFAQRKVAAACTFADKRGSNPQELEEDENLNVLKSGKPLLDACRSRVNLCISNMHDKVEPSKVVTKEDNCPTVRVTQVVAQLLGMAYLVSKICAILNAHVLGVWCSRRVLLETRPLYLGQFAAISSALNSLPSPQIPDLSPIRDGVPRVSYFLDFLLERHPISYILLLTMVCLTLVWIGGFLFMGFRSVEQKPGDAFWDAWSCVCSSSSHLKFKTALERGIGLCLGVGGLLFYSLLTSTMTAQFRSRMEWLREGAHSEVLEEGHVVICGTNNHLVTVLKQLNKAQQLALRDGLTRTEKKTVLLLSEHERRVTERMVAHAVKDLLQLNILIRSGSLCNTASFEKVGAGKADSIIVLASNTNKYEADAESVLTVLALQPLVEKSPKKLVVEVCNMSTSELLKTRTGLKINTTKNLSSKILVQCSRQPGLVDVYRELLEHDRQALNIRMYPNLAGVAYQELRRGFPKAIVCGLIREGRLVFHPPDDLILNPSDKVLMICRKYAYKDASRSIIASSNTSSRKTLSIMAHPLDGAKPALKATEWQPGPKERILLLGWHPRVSQMIKEYDDYVGPGSELIILAEVPAEEREHILKRKIHKELQNVHIIQQVGNPMSRMDLKAAILHPSLSGKSVASKKRRRAIDELPLSILVIAEDTWRVGDRSSPDKKSVLSLLLAEGVCQKLQVEVNSLVAEFVDAHLGKQVMKLCPSLKAIGTDEIVGLVTAQVAEQSELSNVWADLMDSAGDEIYVKEIKRYVKPGEEISFAELAERAILHSEVAIGYTIGGKTVINPPSKEAPLSFSDKDALVVISEFQYSS